MNAAWADPLSRQSSNRRTADRLNVALPARLTWKDQRGSTRFASVLTRDISEFGVFVECQSPISITQFRLVQFQLERDVRHISGIPEALRQGRLLSAVYRIVQPTRSGGRQGLALRLLVDPRRRAKNDASQEAPLDLVASVGLAADLPVVTVYGRSSEPADSTGAAHAPVARSASPYAFRFDRYRDSPRQFRSNRPATW